MQIQKCGFIVFTVLTIISATGLNAEVEPVSPWSGEGNADDSFGPNNGVEVGTVNYAAGEVGLAFDLESGYVDVPNPQGGGLASVTGFTVAAWIREDVAGSSAPVVNLRTPSNAGGFTLESLFGTPGVFMLAVNVSGAGDFFMVVSDGWPWARRITSRPPSIRRATR